MTERLGDSISILNALHGEIASMIDVLKRNNKEKFSLSKEDQDLYVLLKSTASFFLIKVVAFMDEFDNHFKKCDSISEEEKRIITKIKTTTTLSFELLQKYNIREYRNGYLVHNLRVNRNSTFVPVFQDAFMSNLKFPDSFVAFEAIGNAVDDIRSEILYHFSLNQE